MTASVDAARRRALVVLAATFAGGATPARADERPFTIATSTPGGGFALYGETVARVLAARDGRAWVAARPTAGTAENLVLLRDGRVDAALIQGTVASELFGRDDGGDLRILFAMYPSPGLLAVLRASDVRRLEDVRGRRVVLGVRASGLVTLGRQVFDGIGLDVDRDLDAIYVAEAAESPRRVIAGDAVGLWGAGEGWPGFERLAASPGGARFIGPAPGQIPGIVARYPLLRPMEVAAGAYPGIDRPLATVGSVNLIVARADLDVARATRFVAAMHAAEADLAAALPQAAFGTLANTRASAASPAALHAAVRALP